MRPILLNCLILLSASVFAKTATVDSVRVWAAPDSTRIVFDTSGPIKYKLFTLDKPHRAVIDIKNSSIRKIKNTPKGTDRYLKAIRSGVRNKNDLRIVLDLKKPIQYKMFQLKPNKHYGHRLVIDLFDVEIKHKTKQITKKELKKPEIKEKVKKPKGNCLRNCKTNWLK